MSFTVPSHDQNNQLSLVERELQYDVPYTGQPFNVKCGGFWHTGQFYGYAQEHQKKLANAMRKNDNRLSTSTSERNSERAPLKIFSRPNSRLMPGYGNVKVNRMKINQIKRRNTSKTVSSIPTTIIPIPFDTLKIYGDSMGRRFYESLMANHSLCKVLLFDICLYVWKCPSFSNDIRIYQFTLHFFKEIYIS